jgi:hypothetical protein
MTNAAALNKKTRERQAAESLRPGKVAGDFVSLLMALAAGTMIGVSDTRSNTATSRRHLR